MIIKYMARQPLTMKLMLCSRAMYELWGGRKPREFWVSTETFERLRREFECPTGSFKILDAPVIALTQRVPDDEMRLKGSDDFEIRVRLAPEKQ